MLAGLRDVGAVGFLVGQHVGHGVVRGFVGVRLGFVVLRAVGLVVVRAVLRLFLVGVDLRGLAVGLGQGLRRAEAVVVAVVVALLIRGGFDGIGGVLAGAAIGSIGGPIGTVIGGIAGAIGGWWTGRAIAEAASNFSHADDEHFRTDYETRSTGVASDVDRSYDRVRPAYQLGYLASRNPEYAGRSFEDIEPHLERGWTGNAAVEGSDWNEMRDYARTAYVRGAASQSSLTGDSSAKNSLSSTGTHGSVGTGADVPESEPEGTVDQYGRRPTTSFASDSTTDSTRASSGRSSIADDVESRLASPKGSSFTRQGDVPLNSSVTDSGGSSRARGYDNQQSRQRDLQSDDANRGASFTDPVAGEGVENIGSSGLAPRGEDGALNETPADDKMRNEGEGQSQRYQPPRLTAPLRTSGGRSRRNARRLRPLRATRASEPTPTPPRGDHR